MHGAKGSIANMLLGHLWGMQHTITGGNRQQTAARGGYLPRYHGLVFRVMFSLFIRCTWQGMTHV